MINATQTPEEIAPGTALERANSAIIRYPRFRELHEFARRCQDQSKLAGEPQCMSLEGRPGAGKSTLVREYARSFERINTEHGTIIPVFYMETPSPISVKGMAESMLEQLGDPMAHRGTLWSMNSRLVKCLVGCHVELVVLDDFHHLIDRDTSRILQTVSDWLKVLIKESGVPFLCVGIEGQVTQILKANRQLSRLFAIRETLTPFPWNPQDPATIHAFHLFVTYAEKGMQVPLTTAVPRLELLARMYFATDGVVANIMNLLRDAQWQALQRNASHIELQDLATIFRRRLLHEVPNRANPFVNDQEPFQFPSTSPSVTSTTDDAVSKRTRGPRRSRHQEHQDVI